MFNITEEAMVDGQAWDQLHEYLYLSTFSIHLTAFVVYSNTF